MTLSTTDAILDCTRRLESLLETELGASGRGLHEKASSVSDKLSPAFIKKIRRIASIRNKLVHEGLFDVDREEFLSFCKAAILELEDNIRLETSSLRNATELDWSGRQPSSIALKTANAELLDWRSDASETTTSSSAGMVVLFIVASCIVIGLFLMSVTVIRAQRAEKTRSVLRPYLVSPVAVSNVSKALKADVAADAKTPTASNAPSTTAGAASEAETRATQLEPAVTASTIHVQRNAVLQFQSLAVSKATSSWTITGSVKNLTDDALNTASGSLTVTLDDAQRTIGPIHFFLNFGARGLKPGESFHFNKALADGFESRKLEVPAAARAAALRVTLTLETVTDGMGRPHSAQQKLQKSETAGLGSGADSRFRPSFDVQPNDFLRFDEARVFKNGDDWSYTVRVTNVSTQLLQSANAVSVVFVEGREAPTSELDEFLSFGARGLAPGESLELTKAVGGVFSDRQLRVPAIVNAQQVFLRLRLTAVTDDFGKQQRL